MPETQYTGYSFDIAILVVPLLGSNILCSIRTVPEATINSGSFEFTVLTQPYLSSIILTKSDSNRVKWAKTLESKNYSSL